MTKRSGYEKRERVRNYNQSFGNTKILQGLKPPLPGVFGTAEAVPF